MPLVKCVSLKTSAIAHVALDLKPYLCHAILFGAQLTVNQNTLARTDWFSSRPAENGSEVTHMIIVE